MSRRQGLSRRAIRLTRREYPASRPGVKFRVKEIVSRCADSWFSVLFALMPAPLIALGAVLIHFKTDIAYRLLQSEAAIQGIRYFRIGLFAACVLAITAAVIILRKKKPELGRKPFTLFLLAPFAGLLTYLSWTPTLLISLVIAALLVLSQWPLLRDIVSAYQRRQGGFRFLLYFQAATATGLFIFGVMLWILVRDSAYNNAQWIEIKQKGIYGEFADLDELVENPRIEYALITDPALRFHNIQTHRFGSGEDAYTVTYAMLGNGAADSSDPAHWPLWYYCGSGSCYDKAPLLVNVDHCPDPKDCSEDFAWIIRRVRFRVQNSDTTPPYPPTLRLLSPASDLKLTESQWRGNIRFAANVLGVLQLCYFFLHTMLAALNRLLKKP